MTWGGAELTAASYSYNNTFQMTHGICGKVFFAPLGSPFRTCVANCDGAVFLWNQRKCPLCSLEKFSFQCGGFSANIAAYIIGTSFLVSLRGRRRCQTNLANQSSSRPIQKYHHHDISRGVTASMTWFLHDSEHMELVIRRSCCLRLLRLNLIYRSASRLVWCGTSQAAFSQLLYHILMRVLEYGYYLKCPQLVLIPLVLSGHRPAAEGCVRL